MVSIDSALVFGFFPSVIFSNLLIYIKLPPPNYFRMDLPIFRDKAVKIGRIRLMFLVTVFLLLLFDIFLLVHSLRWLELVLLNSLTLNGFSIFTAWIYRSQKEIAQVNVHHNSPALTYKTHLVLSRLSEELGNTNGTFWLSVVEPLVNGSMSALGYLNIPDNFAEICWEFRWGKGNIKGVAGRCATECREVLIPNLLDKNDYQTKDWLQGNTDTAGILCVPIIDTLKLAKGIVSSKCLAVLSISSFTPNVLDEKYLSILQPYVEEIRQLILEYGKGIDRSKILEYYPDINYNGFMKENSKKISAFDSLSAQTTTEPLLVDETDPEYWRQFLTPESLEIAREAGNYRRKAIEAVKSAKPIDPESGEPGAFSRFYGSHKLRPVYKTPSGKEFFDDSSEDR